MKKILCFCCLLPWLAGAKAEPPAANFYWKFDQGQGTVIKNLGTGGVADAVIQNTDLVNWEQDPVLGWGLKFQRPGAQTDGNVVVKNVPGLNFQGAFSIVIGFVCDFNTAGDPTSALLCKGINYDQGYCVLVNNGGSQGVLVSNLKGTQPEYQMTSLPECFSGVYGVAALVCDGKNLTGYFNGKPLSTVPITGKLINNNENLFIGNMFSSPNQFAGKIYFVQLFDRALTSDEVFETSNSAGIIATPDAVRTANATLDTQAEADARIDPAATYFYDWRHVQPAAEAAKWKVREAGFVPPAPITVYPPAGDDSEIWIDPALKGEYDISIGARTFSSPTGVLVKLGEDGEYRNVRLAGISNDKLFHNVDIPVYKNVKMDGKKLYLASSGLTMYLGYVKFVPSGSGLEQPVCAHATIEPGKRVDPDKLLAEVEAANIRAGKFVERLYVDDTPAPAATAEAHDRGYLLYPLTPMAMTFSQTIPKRDYGKITIEGAGVPGEFVSMCFGIRSLRDVMLNPRIKGLPADAEGNPLKAVLDFRMVEELNRAVGAFDVSAGGRVEFLRGPNYLEPVNPLQLAGGISKQFWLNVELSAEAAPGTYRGVIALDGQTEIPFAVEVYPFQLDELLDMDFAMYCGLGVRGEALKTALRDLKRHNMTTLMLFGGDNMVVFSGSTADDVAIDFERSGITEIMDGYREVGFTGNIFMCTSEYLDAKAHEFTGQGKYEAVYLKLIGQLEDYRKANGWPVFYYQSYDEVPSLPHHFPRFIRELKTQKIAGVPTQVDHLWYKTNRPCQQEIDRSVPYIDIFTLRYSTKPMFYVDDWPEIQKIAAERGKKLYMYNTNNACPFFEPTSMRFIGGWIFETLSEPVKGQFMWAYNWFTGSAYSDIDGNVNDDSYYLPPTGSHKGGPTLGWELYRIGIDDLKYIRTLKRLISEARSVGLHTGADATQKVYDDLKNSFDFAMMKEKVTWVDSIWERQNRNAAGVTEVSGDFYLPNGWRAEDYMKARRSLAEAIIKLRNELATRPDDTRILPHGTGSVEK